MLTCYLYFIGGSKRVPPIEGLINLCIVLLCKNVLRSYVRAYLNLPTYVRMYVHG